VEERGLGFQPCLLGNWQSLDLDYRTWRTASFLAGTRPAITSRNLFFHAINTVLLFLLLRTLTGAFWRSACVAALFAHAPHARRIRRLGFRTQGFAEARSSLS